MSSDEAEAKRLRKLLERERAEFAKFIGRTVQLRAELDALIESVRGMDNDAR